MLWRFDCNGGDECEWCHAKSAAYVRDAKPEGDVHSNLPKQRSPLDNRDLTLWRFGFRVRYKVRDHVGHGGTAIFHNVFKTDLHSAVLESTHDCGH